MVGPRTATAIAYGIACHGLFAVAVTAMIVEMFFGMSLASGRVPGAWAIMANALLLVQFPLGHSLLLYARGSGLLRRLAPKPMASDLVTTTYVIVASIQVTLLFVLWTPSGVVWWRADGVVLWLLTALYAVAWLLLLKAISDAGIALQTGALGWWAVARDRRPVYPPMPTTGLFRLVRQPIYVAFALTLWTVPTWTPDQLEVAIVLTGYCLAGPILKERRFRRRFGAAFEAYAQRVPYWLPRLSMAPPARRNDLSIYDRAEDWRSDGVAWTRALKAMVPARMRYFDAVVPEWEGLTVLDVGCGAGFMAEAMAVRGARVAGIDPSAEAIGVATERLGANRLAIDYRVGTGEALPFADAAFDVVVCVDVLEHVADPRAVLSEIRRVLRPEGWFLFDTINRTWLAGLVMVKLGEDWLGLVPRGTHDPARFIKPAELAAMAAGAGLAMVRCCGIGPVTLSCKRDVRFALLPTTAIQYIGHAVVRG
jgi:ubiquinone biosynthesis O-methyltransferase